MRNALLASAALFFLSATPGLAALPGLNVTVDGLAPSPADLLILASDDHGGGDDNGGGGGGAGDDDNDDDNDDDDDDDDNQADGGREHPRVPGGSGCDDPGDVAEHPECGGGAATAGAGGAPGGLLDLLKGSKRHKKRVPGGPGCDDAGDVAEHAECR